MPQPPDLYDAMRPQAPMDVPLKELILQLMQTAPPQQPALDTPLSPAEEAAYRAWMQQIGHTAAAGYHVTPDFTGTDYDYRGYFKKHGPKQMKKGEHFPDEFKKPGHEFFSNESKYAVGADAARAGSWQGETYIPPAAPPPLRIAPEPRTTLGMKRPQ